ncbi:carbamoyltransferase N-terminal domain-containing protein [Helicobacter labetoulli]
MPRQQWGGKYPNNTQLNPTHLESTFSHTAQHSESLSTKSTIYRSKQGKAKVSLVNATPLDLDSIDSFVFYDKPFLTFERLLETYFATAPKGFLSFVKAIPVWLSTKLFLKETIA